MDRVVCYFWKYGGYDICDDSIKEYCNKHRIRIVEIPYEKHSYPEILDEWVNVTKFIQDDIRKNKPILCFSSNHCLNTCVMSDFLGEYNNIVYIDAHADCNTPETSETKNIHGMGLAALCGYGYKPLVDLVPIKCKSIQGIGLRSIDKYELSNVPELELCNFSDIDYTQKSCISFDVDVFDSKYYTSCHLNLEDGLSPDEVRDFFEHIDLDNVGIIEISEINNLTENDEKVLDYVLEPLFLKLNGYKKDLVKRLN